MQDYKYYYDNILNKFKFELHKNQYDDILKHYNDSEQIDAYLNINCKNCIDCYLCRNCYDCTNCIDCIKCIKCKNCVYCLESDACNNSDNCNCCNGCSHCNTMYCCLSCGYCEHCYDCKNIRYCAECHKLLGGSNIACVDTKNNIKDLYKDIIKNLQKYYKMY